MRDIKDVILVTQHTLQGKADFFSRIYEFIEDPEMLEALGKDGIDTFDLLFDSPDKLFNILNHPRAHTRQYLILKRNV